VVGAFFLKRRNSKRKGRLNEPSVARGQRVFYRQDLAGPLPCCLARRQSHNLPEQPIAGPGRSLWIQVGTAMLTNIAQHSAHGGRNELAEWITKQSGSRWPTSEFLGADGMYGPHMCPRRSAFRARRVWEHAVLVMGVTIAAVVKCRGGRVLPSERRWVSPRAHGSFAYCGRSRASSRPVEPIRSFPGTRETRAWSVLTPFHDLLGDADWPLAISICLIAVAFLCVVLLRDR
jgi:hypothetical protein